MGQGFIQNSTCHMHPQIICYRPRSIYQYSNMAPRLSGQTSIFGVVFFVSRPLLRIEGQKRHEEFAIGQFRYIKILT